MTETTPGSSNSENSGLYFSGSGCVRDAVIYGDDGTESKVSISNDNGAEMLMGVSPYLLAHMIGATTENSKEGYASFRIADGEIQHPILMRDGKQYLDLHAFSEGYGFNLLHENGMYILGNWDQWSVRALRAMKMATDPFVLLN